MVKSFTYDAAGREKTVTTSSGTTTLTYDYEDRPTLISYPSGATSTFGYNGLDARTSKTNSSSPKTYLRDGAGVMAPILYDGSTNLTPFVSWHNASGSTFAHADRMGSTKVGTDSTGATTLTRDFDAYGNFIGVTGASYLPWGYAGSSGYWEESESLLKQVGHRYYDPSTGRFLTRDHAKDGRNWYGYCDNNPLRYVDPLGYSALDWMKIIRPIAGTFSGGVLLWSIWELASHAHGNHAPKRVPGQPLLGWSHGHTGGVGEPDVPKDGYWMQRKHMYDPED